MNQQHFFRIGKNLLFMGVALLPMFGQIVMSVLLIRDSRLVLQKGMWLLVIWTVPFLGPILYFLLGRLLFRYWRWSRWGSLVPAVPLLLMIIGGVLAAVLGH